MGQACTADPTQLLHAKKGKQLPGSAGYTCVRISKRSPRFPRFIKEHTPMRGPVKHKAIPGSHPATFTM